MHARRCLGAWVLSWTFLASWAGNIQGAADGADYARDIKPLIKERCLACHGALKKSGGLRLDTGELIRRGGDGGPSVEPGAPDESLLIERVTEPDAALRMPPEGPPLEPRQIEALKAWIAAGAPSPEGEAPEPDPRDHWAFRPPVRPEVPRQEGAAWGRNPIDAFIAAEHHAHGLAPAPEADKGTLLRRVAIDLTGLPPTREELRAFLDDPAPDAYERAVDRLLASPQYGERWGRHWMDVWRYSDWYGRRLVPDVWNSAPQIWRWRDWIVRSLNADKGYDRMVSEMLAADEIAPGDDEAAAATGYLIRNWYALNPNQWMRDNVEHTGKAFLGLTFNCAHCHDHKYDPIKHTDYFAFRAFFEPIGIRQDRMPGEADPGPFQEYEYVKQRNPQRLGMVRIYDKTADAPTWFYTGGDERNRVQDRGTIPPGVPAVLKDPAMTIAAINLPPRAYYHGLQPAIQQTEREVRTAALKQAEAQVAEREKAVAASLPGLRERRDAQKRQFLTAVAFADPFGQSRALAGKRSLILDATVGRRIINNDLKGIRPLAEGTTLSFRLAILRESHVNVQLAKDAVKGLTAGAVIFEAGSIRSYQPGGTAEFEAGRYDRAAGQDLFDIHWTFEPKADRALLTVISPKDGATLVDRVPVAINGWIPAQGLTLDAHTGCVVAFDEIALRAPGPEPSAGLIEAVRLDFESPEPGLLDDVVGRDGWFDSNFQQAPAWSFVADTTAWSDDLAREAGDLRATIRGAEACELGLASAEARRTATRDALASLEATIIADRAKYGEAPDQDPTATGRGASRAERAVSVLAAEAALAEAKQRSADLEAKPTGDKAWNDSLKAATAALIQARTALDAARAAASDPGRDATYSPLSLPSPSTSTGRRKALAEWITGPRNPLTARVAINHMWMRHFHAPLVATVFDFGRNGARPTHPALLDWLAVELMESGWSQKHIHRLIVTSRAYRMDSSTAASPENPARDPANAFLWRMNPGRMEAEVVRDGILRLAGDLDLAMGGQELENDKAATTRRRSLYYACYPEDGGKSEFGALFDAADAAECYRRPQSIVPQQALALTNSELIHGASAKLAAALGKQIPAGDFIAAAFEQILSRPPTPEELALCTRFLDRQAAALKSRNAPDVDGEARASLVRALFNHNDFLTIR